MIFNVLEMPNWCACRLYVKSENSTMLKEFKEHMKSDDYDKIKTH